MAVRQLNFRTILKIFATAISTLWIGVTVYSEFFDVDPDQYSFKSPEVEQRMKACSGSFHERYRCKEDAIIDKGQEGFVIWLEKVGLVFGPPFVLFGLVRLLARQRPGDDTESFIPPPPIAIAKRRVR